MYRQRKPVEALRPWVAALWHSRRTSVVHERELALPTGASSWVLRLDGDPIRLLGGAGWQKFSGGVLWGSRTNYVVRDTSRLGSVVGVQFRPGMASAFLGCPAGEWVGRHVELEPAGLLERLRNSSDPLVEMEQALLEMRPRPFDAGIHWAVGEIVKAPQLIRVERLRLECGYSVRRFSEGFRDSVGLTPKEFTRVRRFGVALRALASGSLSLTELALDCGYCDQPHLNREFREFAGLTPSGYRPVHPEWVFHVAAGNLSKTI